MPRISPLIFLLLFCSQPIFSDVTKSVRATGLGFIVERDKAAAFGRARDAALREAVEEAMGTLISSHTQVHNFALIEDNIFSRTEGYVRSFEVVEQGAIDEQTYRVVVDAQVSLGQLHHQLDALNLLIEAAGNPRIVCIGRERLLVNGQERDVNWGIVANELTRVLQQASDRFTISSLKLNDSMQNLAIEELVEHAAGQADIVIVGDVVVEEIQGIRIPFSSASLESRGIKSANANLQIRAMWADNRRALAALKGVRKAAASSLEAAALKGVGQGIQALSGELLEKLAKDWQQKVYSGRLIRLEIEAQREKVNLFERDFAARVGGIERVYPRSFADGLAIYEIQAKNSAYQVARELSAKGLVGADVEILQVSLNTLKVKIR